MLAAVVIETGIFSYLTREVPIHLRFFYACLYIKMELAVFST